MDRLSLPIDRLESRYDVVVVGSGYGGAVAACRLAALKNPDGTPVRVCLLERGPEKHPGQYPRTFSQFVREIRVAGKRWSFGSRRGMFDFHLNPEISVLVGSGLGGTSLINAGVMLRPNLAELKRNGWPAALFDRALCRGFRDARKMIRPRPYPRPEPPAQLEPSMRPDPSRWPHLNKRAALEAVREPAAHPPSAWSDVPVAVSFATAANAAGVQQQACRLCGDCVTGCNYSAKSTLLMNYIPAAVRNGAEVFCEVSVRWLEPGPDGWRLHLAPLDGGWKRFRRGDDLVLEAKIVVLAAGTLGTTEILQRSAEKAGGLALSCRLGAGFTGNGDVVAFGYNNDVAIDGVGCGRREPDENAPVGPTITSMLDERGADPGILIQEGAVPGPVAILLRLFGPLAARISRYGGTTKQPPLGARLRAWGREVTSFFHSVRAGALRNTQTYLVFGDDTDGGRDTGTIELRGDRARVRWPGVGRKQLFLKVNERLRLATRRLGGTHVANPFWSAVFGFKLVTVHPLGGCRMACDAAGGVVNHKGQVFRRDGGEAVYDTLYVCDGSVIPTPLGVNPLWTISAFAERACALLARDHGLTPRERGAGPPRRRRELPRGAARPGLAFTERMRGTLRSAAGGGRNATLDLLLHVTSPDVERMISGQERGAGVMGLALAPLLSPEPLRVERGGFNLFTALNCRVETRNIAYNLHLAAADGSVFELKGAKTVRDGPGPRRPPWIRWRDLWREMTTLPYELFQEPRVPGSGPVARGVLRIRWPDVARSIASLRITDAANRGEQFRWTLRFARFYLGVLYHSFGWPFGERRVDDPFTEAQQFRALFDYRAEPPKAPPRECPREGGRRAPLAGPGAARAPVMVQPGIMFEEYDILTPDRVPIHLSHYWDAANLGEPVLLVGGFGTSTFGFTVATHEAERNFTEFLVDEGHDVWLLDYRASELSPGSGTQFTIDDVVRYDYPTAVKHICEVTGHRVRVFGHCVASMALLMGLLTRDLTEEHVRAAVCSQSFLFIHMPRINRLKAHLRIANVLHFLRFWPTLTPDWERSAPLRDRVFDRLLRLYPSDERCQNPVCRRILFLYGEAYRHDQLDKPTHTAIRDMFNRSNLTTFLHLTDIVRRRRVVDHRGRNEYLRPDNVRNIKVPVTLVQGAKNGLFLRSGGVKSFEWLRDNAETQRRELFRWCELDDYGHMDTFIGRYTYDGERDRPPGAPAATYCRLLEALRRD